MTEPWLGHHDLCSIAWSDYCDCEDPNNPILLTDEGVSDGEAEERNSPRDREV